MQQRREMFQFLHFVVADRSTTSRVRSTLASETFSALDLKQMQRSGGLELTLFATKSKVQKLLQTKAGFRCFVIVVGSQSI